MRKLILITSVLAALLAGAVPASGATVDKPRNDAPSWFTPSFKALVDASGTRGVPMDDHSVLDVCPGVVAFHEGGVGAGTCLVVPYGCTANFVYYAGAGTTAPAVSDGSHYLGSAGHCSDKVGEPVYGAISTPGVGTSIARIGTIAKRIDDYDGSRVYDFEAIRIDPGFAIYPETPVGGPQGVYDGCAIGTPLTYYGHGYEIAVAQGKPEGGIATHWFDDGYGWEGPAFGGDSGSGVVNAATGQAAGNLTAIILVSPPYLPGEIVGSRMTWILAWTGFSLVNADFTLARDTTSACGSDGSGDDGDGSGGGKGDNGGGGQGKGGGKGNTKA